MAGKKGQGKRTEAEKQAVISAASAVVKASPRPMDLRSIFYKLLPLGEQGVLAFPDTDNNYNVFGGWLVDVRKDEDDDRVTWADMKDGTRGVTDWPAWADPTTFTSEWRDAYRRDVWPDQPVYVEVWLEKEGLSDLFLEALEPFRVSLNVGRGYDGWSSRKDAADRFIAAAAEGKECYIPYFGDFDPSGLDMPRSLRESLAEVGAFPTIWQEALTEADTRALPEQFKPVKMKDPRAPEFVARYGDRGWEINALDDEETIRRVRTTVAELMDLDALRETLALEREERAAIRAAIDSLS